MLITLYGPDSYRRLRKLNEILDTYREKYTGFSHERFNLAEEETLDRLKNFVSTRSMFDSVRLVILDNILDHPSKKELKELLKANTETKDITIIINLDKNPPATHKFLLEKGATSQEFSKLKGEKMVAFIKQTADRYKLKLDAQTIRLLADTFGGDTWGLVTEVEQMSHSTNYTTEVQPSTDYFGLVNSIKHGDNLKKRLVALEIILSDRKDEPARVFNTLAYRPSSESEANRYADYDVKIKSGKLEYEEVLLELALGA